MGKKQRLGLFPSILNWDKDEQEMFVVGFDNHLIVFTQLSKIHHRSEVLKRMDPLTTTLSPDDDLSHIEGRFDQLAGRYSDSKNILLTGDITANERANKRRWKETGRMRPTIELNRSIDILVDDRSTVGFPDHSKDFSSPECSNACPWRYSDRYAWRRIASPLRNDPCHEWCASVSSTSIYPILSFLKRMSIELCCLSRFTIFDFVSEEPTARKL